MMTGFRQTMLCGASIILAACANPAADSTPHNNETGTPATDDAPTETIWTGIDVGTAAGFFSDKDGTITLTGQGKWESDQQTTFLLYTAITGDFTCSIKIDSAVFPDLTKSQGRAGLFILPVKPLSTQTGTDLVFAGGGKASNGSFLYNRRVSAAASAGGGNLGTPSGTGADVRLRLTRSGGSVKLAYSLDGSATWGADTTFSLSLGDTAYLALGINSSVTTSSATAVFSALRLVDAAGNPIAGVSDGTGGTDPGSGTTDPPDPVVVEPGQPAAGSVVSAPGTPVGFGAATTGGSGAAAVNTYVFTRGAQLQAFMLARAKLTVHPPTTIYLSGTFTDGGRDGTAKFYDVKDVANISLIGLSGFVMDKMGLYLVRAENVIVHNIVFRLPLYPDDAVGIDDCGDIWVDHCTFLSLNQATDAEDGACDIKGGTRNVTISWNHFNRTQKSMLFGPSASQTEDSVTRVSYHHNFFDNSGSRHPRVRYGTAHVYNNYYLNCSGYGVGSACEAHVLIENNCFSGVKLPIDIATFANTVKESGESNLTDSVAGFIAERNNIFSVVPSGGYGTTGKPPLINADPALADPWSLIDYTVVMDAAADIPALALSAGAVEPTTTTR